MVFKMAPRLVATGPDPPGRPATERPVLAAMVGPPALAR